MFVCGVGPLGWLLVGRHTPLQRFVGSLGAALAVVLLLAGSGDPKLGLDKDLEKQAPLLDRIAELPEDVLLAGFPSGAAENVPLLGRRPVLLNRESHQAFHRDFLLETRRRMDDFIAAYYATEEAPVRWLMSRYGVTHMLVKRGHFTGKPPRYHAPFGSAVKRAVKRAGGDFIMLKLAEGNGVVAKASGYVIVDLERALASGA
jgi:hypothetical protein